jgi:signal transduction histidine kinase
VAGANTVIALVGILAALTGLDGSASEARMVAIIAGSVLLALAVNLVLVNIALAPLRQIEQTAHAIAMGDIDARVPDSPLADRNMVRVGQTLNALLDVLGMERNRLRELARRLITVGDAERAAVATALHDSAAQSLAALAMQASAAAGASEDRALRERLAAMRNLSVEVLEEIRAIGQSLYPQTLHTLGLDAALRNLARQMTERQPHVTINVDMKDGSNSYRLTPPVSAVLYEVAREGINNSLRHADAHSIELKVEVQAGEARLTVADDGCGFDVQGVGRGTNGTGLLGIRERLALVDGRINIDSGRGTGTRLSVTVPIDTSRSQ